MQLVKLLLHFVVAEHERDLFVLPLLLNSSAAFFVVYKYHAHIHILGKVRRLHLSLLFPSSILAAPAMRSIRTWLGAHVEFHLVHILLYLQFSAYPPPLII